jgi:hypothetical protein
MNKSNLLFIGGYMHSGTTLMHEISSNHENVLNSIKESKILEWESAWQMGYDKETNKISYLLNTVLRNTIKKSNFIPEGKNVKIDFFKLLEYEANKDGLAYYLEGSPNSYIWLDKIPTELDYKMILVTRDPRNILASVKKRIKSKNFGNASNFKGRITNYYSLFIYANSVKRSFKKLLDLEKQPNMLMVDYYNITKEYDQTLALLSSFLSLDLDSFPSADQISTRNSADKNAIYKEGLYYSSNYKKVLNKREIIVIEYLFKDYFNKTDFLGVKPKKSGLLYYLPYLIKAPFDVFIFIIARFIRFSSWNRFTSYLKTTLKRVF